MRYSDGLSALKPASQVRHSPLDRSGATKESCFRPAGPIGSSLLGGALLLVGTSVQAAPAAPFAATQAPTAIRETSAVLNGMATPNGLPSVAWFEWRANASAPWVSGVVDVGEGLDVVHVSAAISNLPATSALACRLVVSNAMGRATGPELLFTTGGEVAAWGTGLSLVPAGLSQVVAVGSGQVHGLALRNDGTLAGWGAEPDVPPGADRVVAIGAGGFHNLALNADGTVLAWGDNRFGQTNVPPGLSNVVALAAGAEHSLALRRDGTVVAWGNAGDGRTDVPEGLSNVVAIAAGSHSLALCNDGHVIAWGNNLAGQAEVPAGLDRVVGIACGYQCSLALREDGSVICWGSNDTGQTYVPRELGNVRFLAGGELHNLAIRGDGKVVPWGVDLWFGQHEVPADLGRAVSALPGHDQSLALCPSATEDWPNSPPRALSQWAAGPVGRDLVIRLTGVDDDGDPLTFQVTALPSMGRLFQFADGARGAAILPGTAVTDTTGRVMFVSESGVGGDPYARFAFLAHDGARDSWPATVEVSLWERPFAATQPAAVQRHTQVSFNGMATPNGWPTVAWFEWGSDASYGQRTEPVPVGEGDSVVRVTAGISDLVEHQVLHYRLVASNQLGIATGIDHVCVAGASPAGWGANEYGQASIPGSWDDVVAVWGGAEHSLALRSDGTVLAWGANEFGQTNVPSGLSNGIAVAGGYGRSIALRSDGTVTAWGFTGQADLVAGLSNIVAIEGFDQTFAALRNDGRVVTWGVNYVGELDVPSDLRRVVSIDVGWHHVVALRSNGTIESWGWCAPAPPDLDEVGAVTAGGSHDLALRNDGTVIAWGGNLAGQTNVPAGLQEVIAVTAGADHSLALRNDGTVVAWGMNDRGQTNVPSALTNVVGVKAGSAHSLALKVPAAPPRITIEPPPQTAVFGASATFAVVVGGGLPLHYEWQRDGVPVAGANGPTLTLSPLTRLDEGDYRVVVTNALGRAASSNAFLRVRVPQRIVAVERTSQGTLQIRFRDSYGTGMAEPANLELQAATDLSGTNAVWTRVDSPQPIATDGIFLFEDAGASNSPRRFYRVVEK